MQAPPVPNICCSDRCNDSILVVESSACCNMIRDSFSDDPPADQTKAWICNYRNGASTTYWDNVYFVWR